MQAGRFTVGDFALFTSYLANIGFSISLFGYMVFQHKRLKVSFDRMRSLFRPGEEDWIIEARETYLNEEPPELPVIHREPGEVLKELEVKNLSYHYPNSENGISDINFRLERGKFLVVTGRIGAGKSTLVRTLLGLPKQEGTIRWNGEEVDPATFLMPPRATYTRRFQGCLAIP